MTVDAGRLQAGQVLVVEGTSLTSKLIEIGAIVRGELAASHVAVLHHQAAGGWWAIEGRPGGVGWVQAHRYLADPRTLANTGQNLSGAQISAVTGVMVKLLGTPYDWAGGIAADAAEALHLPVNWAANDPATGLLPGHVVCSSAAAYAYDLAGAPNPGLLPGKGPGANGLWERVTPGDWATFITDTAWDRSPTG